MKRILIVDDEEKISNLYRNLLSSQGYEVFTVNSASAAYEFLKGKVDLILLDINMPGVSGDELYEVIRLFNPAIKVIVTSVYSLEKQQKMIKGASYYYDKSEGINLLLSRIKEVFKNEADKKSAHCRH